MKIYEIKILELKVYFLEKKKSLDGPNSQMNMLDEKVSKLEKNKTKSPRLKIKQR